MIPHPGKEYILVFLAEEMAGKSSVVKAVTDQELAVVSDTKGTTTDPVSKAMELLPLGPVLLMIHLGLTMKDSLENFVCGKQSRY